MYRIDQQSTALLSQFSLSSAEFLHHLSKLLEGDLAVAICIDLFHDIVDGVLAELFAEAENFLDLWRRNVARAVLNKGKKRFSG